MSMAGHRAGVPEAEVDVFVPVNVDEPSTMGLLDGERKRTRPASHPRHGYAGHQSSAERCHFGTSRVSLDERTSFGGKQLGHAESVHARGYVSHTSSLPHVLGPGLGAVRRLPNVTATSSTTAAARRINGERLLQRIAELAEIGAIDGGGCNRLAVSDDDRLGRERVIAWMQAIGLAITTGDVGNVTATWDVGSGKPVMTGSHIDTVRTGGKYDGNYGVLAGLEVIETCRDLGITPGRPLAVAFFTNEEGARFAPDMLGSLVYVGGMSAGDAHDIVGIDGARLGDELSRIGALGTTPTPGPAPFAFVELHIEQGPVLEANDATIGAVSGVQGISWTELTITGQSNHAGTTPMALRHDAVFVAAKITAHLRDVALRYGGNQVCTVGKIDVHPNLVNVVAAKVTMTLDVRNTDEQVLRRAEAEIREFWQDQARTEGVDIVARRLARFEPVVFDERVVSMVRRTAIGHGLRTMDLPSGAGHDAQMLARVSPSAMIFVPSHRGISHNPAEHTDADDLVAGAQVLCDVMLQLAQCGDESDIG